MNAWKKKLSFSAPWHIFGGGGGFFFFSKVYNNALSSYVHVCARARVFIPILSVLSEELLYSSYLIKSVRFPCRSEVHPFGIGSEAVFARKPRSSTLSLVMLSSARTRDRLKFGSAGSGPAA